MAATGILSGLSNHSFLLLHLKMAKIFIHCNTNVSLEKSSEPGKV